MTTYGPYTIKPKRDFGPHGYLINGKRVQEGFVVCYRDCNAAKGATWFLTVEKAKAAIDEGHIIDPPGKIDAVLDGNR